MNLYNGKGNARRDTFRNCTLPRMYNTVVLPGKFNYNDTINNVQNGILVKSCLAGCVNYINGVSSFTIILH